MKLNNVNLATIGTLAERAKADVSVLRMQKRVDGAWSSADGTPQFSATLAHAAGETVLRADMAPGFGGGGLAPDPLQYMLFGLAACYSATLVMLASMEGVTLDEVRATAENSVDSAKVFGFGTGPLVERVSVKVTVRTSADDASLSRWEQAAREKCPFAFTVANAVPLETRVTRA